MHRNDLLSFEYLLDVSDEMFKLLTENKSKTGKKSLKSLQVLINSHFKKLSMYT